MSILVITTGGTIGALPCEDPRRPPEFVEMPADGKNFVCEAMEQFGPATSRCVAAAPRNSKLIDDSYRQDLLNIVKTASENEILITHGTDALLQTADFFYRQSNVNPALANKIVLLTGSMIPLANGPESDGYLNLEFSLEQLNRLAAAKKENSGVYIVLCDYEDPGDESSAWKPRLYRYYPGQFEKLYSEDRRYSRLRRIKENA